MYCDGRRKSCLPDYCRMTLLLALSSELQNPAISLASYALSTGSESMNASNTSSSLLPTKFSQLPNLHTFITSSLFNVLVVLALHPSLLLLGHLNHVSKNNWSLLLLCFTVSLESTSFISSSTTFWHQFRLTYYFHLSFITFSSSVSPLCSSITPSLSLPA